MRQSSRDTFALLGIFCLLAPIIHGQSLNIYNVSVAETKECTWNPYDSGRTVLQGEAYIPPESHYSSFIVFDGRSKTSGYQQLCLINTASYCQDWFGFPECYCIPSDVVNMYTFVVNLTEESVNGKDQIRAYLLAEDSRRLQEVEITLPSSQGNTLAVTTDLTINGESVGEDCNKTINSNELILKAECKDYLTSCWLELDLDKPEDSIISSGMINFQEVFKEESSVTFTLRRSVCGKGKFEITHTCKIDFVQDTALLEADTTNTIIIVCVLVPLVLIVAVIGIIVYICRRKHSMKHSKQGIEESPEPIEKGSFQNPSVSEIKVNQLTNVTEDDHRRSVVNTDERTALLTPIEKQGNNKFDFDEETHPAVNPPISQIKENMRSEILVDGFEKNSSKSKEETQAPEKPPHATSPTQQLNTQLCQCLNSNFDTMLNEELEEEETEEENPEDKDYHKESYQQWNTNESISYSAIREEMLPIKDTC